MSYWIIINSFEMMIRSVSPFLAVLRCDVIVPVGSKNVISSTASWPGWRLLSDLWQVEY